jgi:hypothetical protein
MLEITQWDSSYFRIELSGISQLNPLYEELTNKVISFSITEENNMMMTGDIVFKEDDNQMMSTILAVGKSLDITWGYKGNNITSLDITAKMISNPTEIYSPAAPSRFCKGLIKSISGAGDASGKQEIRVSFVALMLDKALKNRNFTNDTLPGCNRQMAVTVPMLELGATPIIDFSTMMESTKEFQINQTNFRFLSNLAFKYNCLFRLGFTKLGTQVGLFCDYDNDTAIQAFINQCQSTLGVSCVMNYKLGSPANVKSYDWTINPSQGGGDNVRIMYQNGNPVFLRTIATPQSTIVYKLNSAKIATDLGAQGNPAKMVALVSELLKIDTMDELVNKKYFEPVSQTTAPQGIGMQINLEVLGNPYLSPPARIKFGEGFPNAVKIKTLIYFIQKVTHKIDRTGYSCTLNVIDAWQFGLSMVGVR